MRAGEINIKMNENLREEKEKFFDWLRVTAIFGHSFAYLVDMIIMCV